MMTMNDIMMDLETMDNVGSAAIVAIGAVQCDLTTGALGEEYYRVVELEGQKELNMSIHPSTIYWWLDQSNEARAALTAPGRVPLPEMCETFSKWLFSLGNPQHLKLWGNGASFDNAILRYAYRQVAAELPVPFWNDRDMRTLVGFYPTQLQVEWRRKILRGGIHHSALDDAKHQVRYCSNILKELGVKELY